MFTSSEAIVLQLIPHKEYSAVVKLFTRQNGLASCWINSIHSKSSGIRTGILQPLTVVNVILDQRKHQNLPVIKELQLSVPMSSIPSTIEKSAIAIFIAELLSRCFKENQTEHSMYDFIQHAILILENTTEKCANFHILFMLRLAELLGIFPKGAYSSSTPFLSLEDGVYCGNPPMHKPFIFPAECEWLSKLSFLHITEFAIFKIPAASRVKILHGLIEYFEIHAGTGQLKSHLILEEIF
jgi:DNA repair protein RecO (recombination protein O)